MANGMRFSMDKLSRIASNVSSAVEHRISWSGRTEACIRDCLESSHTNWLVSYLHARSNAILLVKRYLPRFWIHDRPLETPCHSGARTDWTARLVESRNANLSISVSNGQSAANGAELSRLLSATCKKDCRYLSV